MGRKESGVRGIYIQNRMLPEKAPMIHETIVFNMRFHSHVSGTRAPEMRTVMEDLSWQMSTQEGLW
jgi:hypothetical protein